MPGIVHETTLTLDGKYLYTTLRKVNKIVVVEHRRRQDRGDDPPEGLPRPRDDGAERPLRARHQPLADLVSVIDLTTHKQVRTIPVGKAPHGMALRPALESAAGARSSVAKRLLPAWVVALALLPAGAMGHAVLVKAVPPQRAILTESPPRVRVLGSTSVSSRRIRAWR